MNTRGVAPPQLLELAGRIADGAKVDWAAEGEAIEPDLLARLREVEALAGRHLFDEPDPTEPPAFDPGSRFDRLQILERIGAGASGVVYRARDPVIDREVALKVCAPDAERRAALLREAQQMARIDHPNVLRVYGAVEHDGVVGFWSDLVRGESLETWMNSRPPLSTGETAVIGLELCAALAAIHGQGLVHGDIKPGNIIRHASGRWVLIDFGSTSGMAEGLATSGTPRYLAPELFASAAASAASDIYALGVLLFRLAAGVYPQEAEDLATLMQSHRSGARKRLMDLKPELHPGLLAAIEKALEPRAEHRHRSAGEFAHGIAAALPRRAAGPRAWLAVAAALSLALVLAVSFLRPAAVETAGPQLALQRVGTDGEQSIRDGDAIRPGDTLALRYRNASPAHVYVVNEDAEGRSFQLFPLPGAALQNPLPADTEIRLPGQVDGQDVDWEVTTRGGRERFYIVVSDHPLPTLVEQGLVQAGSVEAAMSVQGDLLAGNGDVLRGASGLRARSAGPASGPTDFAKWLAQLQRDEPQVFVERVELRNP